MMLSTFLPTPVHTPAKGLRLPSRASPGLSHSSSLVCRAASDMASGSFVTMPEKSAQRIGLDTSEGIFGFTPFSELWTGRLAMAGFTVGVVEEMITGQPMLEQIGLTSGAPIDALLAALVLAMCTPTAILSAKTLVDAQTGQMSIRQFQRWSKLFGLNTENDAEVVAYMKKADGLAGALRLRDETTSGGGQELPLSDAPSCALPREDASLGYCVWESRTEREIEADASMAYAREVEINNGRWAMVGFAAAICAEAASGGGVFSQLTWVCKAAGLLGLESGL